MSSLFLSNFKEIAMELSLTKSLFLSNFKEIAMELSLANLVRDNSVIILVEFEGNRDGIVPR